MIIQHNLLAMNGERMLGINNKKKDKAMGKLSSGYKINMAADDASGLQISEKMRKQIRGLTQASANAQDGISLIQTAEGAMAEISDIVNRMEEMAVHAANGTLAPSDREAIDAEYTQLKTEIDRIKATTKFNELYALGGEGQTWGGGTTKTPTHYESFNFFNSTYKGGLEGASGPLTLTKDGTISVTLEDTRAAGGSVSLYTLLTDYLDNIYGPAHGWPTDYDDILKHPEAGPITYTDFDLISLTYTDDKRNETKISIVYNPHIGFLGGLSGYTGPVASLDLLEKFNGIFQFSGTTTPKDFSAEPWNNDTRNYFCADLDDMFQVIADLKLFEIDEDHLKSWSLTGDIPTELKIISWEDPPDPFRVPIHVGADGTKNNQITIEVDSLDCRALRLLDTNLKTEENALTTINRVGYANKRVSAARAKLGAEQNRLEHTIKNLDNVIENTQAAESIIRDTDMAREMVEYSKQQILEQAGQSVLTQAQSSNQGVLTLLG